MNIQHLADQNKITAMVTDSGLGGISVAAELYRALRQRSRWQEARIIFFNALFDEQSGYNRIEPFARKVQLFDGVLQGMLRYAPDVILIACNTLSVVYPHTQFAQAARLPVLGIVELGVQYILEKVGRSRDAAVIIFATPTTIQAGVHRAMLRHELADIEIVEQACPELMFAIGDGEIEQSKRLIEDYTVQAVQKLRTPPANVYASLNCTHFGYYQDEFLQAFRRHGIPQVEVLNPNAEMVERLLPEIEERTVPCTDVCIEFVSKVRFNPKGMEALIPLLEPFSQEVVSAFRNYRWNPDVF